MDNKVEVENNNLSQDNSESSDATITITIIFHPVTSVAATGSDDAPLNDETSQQSTLSNISTDPQCVTPKSLKNDPYNHGNLPLPIASPDAEPHSEEYEVHSTTHFPRTPPSPGFNHVAQENFKSATKKSNSLCKLYDMDDDPDRRDWLDKLLNFMRGRGTPITACPMISKKPLDLYELYLCVMERAGYVEVCKVPFLREWKNIAGVLGIGTKRDVYSALKEQYLKYLLPFECCFDQD